MDFFWYKKYEYKKLTKEQRAKLYEWQKSKDGKYITHKKCQSSGQNTKVSDNKKFQDKISRFEDQFKVVYEGPTDREIEVCLSYA